MDRRIVLGLIAIVPPCLAAVLGYLAGKDQEKPKPIPMPVEKPACADISGTWRYDGSPPEVWNIVQNGCAGTGTIQGENPSVQHHYMEYTISGNIATGYKKRYVNKCWNIVGVKLHFSGNKLVHDNASGQCDFENEIKGWAATYYRQ